MKLITLSDKALIAAARCDADGENDIVSVKDATYIQMYVAKLDGHGNVGTYYESEVTPTTALLPSRNRRADSCSDNRSCNNSSCYRAYNHSVINLYS